MTTRAQVVAQARSWLETKYRHQHRDRKAGVDCVGLVIGVARELGLFEEDFDVNGYERYPDGQMLKRECDKHMDRVATSVPGDVVLLRFAAEPQHLAFVGDARGGGRTLVHALSTAGKVVEHRFAYVWQARTVQAYRLRGVSDV